MRTIRFLILALIALAPLGAADRQPQNLADSDSLRALIAKVPCSTWSASNSAPT